METAVVLRVAGAPYSRAATVDEFDFHLFAGTGPNSVEQEYLPEVWTHDPSLSRLCVVVARSFSAQVGLGSQFRSIHVQNIYTCPKHLFFHRQLEHDSPALKRQERKYTMSNAIAPE
jgi:hypothetical protein